MLTLASALDRARRVHGARAAIVEPERTWSWAEHAERVARAAGALGARGLAPGARFGILGRNSRRQCELLHAGYWSGVVPVPVNVRLAPPEIAYVLANAGCRALAVDPALAALLEQPALAGWKDRAFLLGPAAAATGLPAFDDLIAHAAPRDVREAREDEDAILLYTGGTTGRAKGVRLTHRNVVANALQVTAVLRHAHDDVSLHVAPMFHSADLCHTAFTLVGGAHAYLGEFAPPAFLEAVQRARVTFTMLAPTMLIMVLQHPEFARHDLGSLRHLLYGSSPMAEIWIRRALEALPHARLTQGYGLTETAPLLTFLEHHHHRAAIEAGRPERLASAGQALPGVDLRIVDDAGRELPAGAAGEVAVRGPNVTPGYLDLPEANAQALRDGWFHTGDVGRLDEDGFLYLLDRKKDLIVTGGENVYSSEVEAALYEHPGLAEAAVIAVPDEVYGEAVFAVVVAKPGNALTAEDIVAHCRGRIGGYKIPRRFAFVEALPKSALGKVLKAELRKRYAAA